MADQVDEDVKHDREQQMVDIAETYGFASAAKYIATSCMEVSKDCRVYDTGTITVVEIMGRHAGWLAGSAALASACGSGPDLIYLPEVDFDMEQFLADNHVSLNPEFELATSEMIVQFALRNLGVGCVVKDFAREYIEEGTLFELRFNKMIPKRQFCIVRNQKNPLSAAAGKLLEIIYANSP